MSSLNVATNPFSKATSSTSGIKSTAVTGTSRVNPVVQPLDEQAVRAKYEQQWDQAFAENQKSHDAYMASLKDELARTPDFGPWADRHKQLVFEIQTKELGFKNTQREAGQNRQSEIDALVQKELDANNKLLQARKDQNAQLQAQAEATQQQQALQAQKQQAGQNYLSELGTILAGQHNYRTAVDNQQDVVQQTALGGWTGAAGALAGQQKAAQLGVTQTLQDRAADAQDIFATNSAIAQKTQAALQNEFTLNQKDFETQVGYSQQFLDNAQAALQYATGEQKLQLQNAIDKYQNLLQQYQNSYQSDRLDDNQKWTIIKGIAGAVVAVASVVAAPFTGGASLAGVGAGVAIAKS